MKSLEQGGFLPRKKLFVSTFSIVSCQISWVQPFNKFFARAPRTPELHTSEDRHLIKLFQTERIDQNICKEQTSRAFRSTVNFHGGNIGAIKIDQLAMINYAFLLSWLRSFCKTQALTFNNPYLVSKRQRE